MDGRHFDDLSRTLAHATTRRTVWRSAVGLAAGWFATRPRDYVSAQDQCVPLSGGCTVAAECCGTPDVDCCAGVCTFIHDATNCGSCGNTCESSSQCCGDACIPLSDPNNCGGCGVTCGPCQVCSDVDGTGACVSACTGTQGCLDGVCTDCPAGLTICGGICVDLLTDFGNCGTCGNGCHLDFGTPHDYGCFAGRCECAFGLDLCEEESGFICIDTSIDTIHCGGCHNPCFLCFEGQCGCPEGRAPCSSTCCPDGEVCISSSTATCGPCEAGRFGCDGLCVDLSTDPANCGTCASACAADQVCSGGICQAAGGEEPPPTPEEIPTAGPIPTTGPMPTAGPVELPSTGTGAHGRPSDRDRVPLVGTAAALGLAATAWIRSKLRTNAAAREE